MDLTYSEIAVFWLRHPLRRGQSWLEFPFSDAPFKTKQFMALKDGLRKEARHETLDTIEAIAKDFVYQYPRFVGWWKAALFGAGVRIDFVNHEPLVAAPRYLLWKCLSDRLDQDALVAFAYANAYARESSTEGSPGPSRVATLNNWGVLPVYDNHWVRRRLGHPETKLFDLHTHLEGCESAQYLWQKVCDGSIREAQIGAYLSIGVGPDGERLDAPGGFDETARVRLRHEVAIKARRYMERLYREAVRAHFVPFSRPRPHRGEMHGGDIDPRRPYIVAERLWEERELLIFVWRRLLERENARQDEDLRLRGRARASLIENRSPEPLFGLFVALDDYLHLKQWFLEQSTQRFGAYSGVGTNPGLTNFKRYFQWMKLDLDVVGPMRAPLFRLRSPVASKAVKWMEIGPRSERREAQRFFRLVTIAQESPRLTGIELRVAAMDRYEEYLRFFRRWEFRRDKELARRNARPAELQREWPGRKEVATAFVIHFLRWAPEGRRAALREPMLSAAYQDVDSCKARAIMSRQSAVLHRFRWDEPGLAKWIVGIDVANLERCNPIADFSFYIRLLRGAVPVIERKRQLDQDLSFEEWDERLAFERSDYVAHWRSLWRAGRGMPPHFLPKLGLSYHVGEDYYSVFDGWKAIWEAVNQTRMEAGDRLGHALALGDDPMRRQSKGHAPGSIPLGEALDTLVWLRRRCSGLPGVDPRTIRQLEDDIDRFSQLIYGERIPADSLYEVQKAKHWPPLKPDETLWFSSIGERKPQKWWKCRVRKAYRADLFPLPDDETRAARAQHVLLPQALLDRRVLADIERVRTELIALLVRKGIVVEVNPTSNLCVGGLATYSQHPIFNVIRKNKDIKFTISCDDPGTFATRIENEYAAMIDAIDDLPEADRDEAKRAIERAHEVASEASFNSDW